MAASPALPSLNELKRRSSAAAPARIAAAADYLQNAPSHNIAADGTEGSAVFSPSGDAGSGLENAAFAVYELSVPEDTSPATLTLNWAAEALPEPGKAWLALSNWELERWVFQAVLPGSPLNLDDWADYSDDGQRLFVAVIVEGSVPCTLEWLRAGGNTPPRIDLAITPDGISAPSEVAFDASASSDLDGSIANYEWDWFGNGSYDDQGAEMTAGSYEYHLGGRNLVRLRLTDNEGLSTEQQFSFELEEHAPWWRLGRDRRNSRRTAIDGPQSEPAAADWQYELDGSPSVGPLQAADGTLLVITSKDKTVLMNPDGQFIREFGADLRVFNIASNGLLIAQITDDLGTTVYGLDMQGEVVWDEVHPRFTAQCLGVGLDGSLFFGSADTSGLYALDPDDGTERWHKILTGTRFTNAAIGDDGTIYFVHAPAMGSGGSLMAYSADGEFLWDDFAHGIAAPVIGEDGTLYVGDNGYLNAFDPQTQSRKWFYNVPGSPDIGPLALGVEAGSERIYFGAQDENLYSIKPDGTLNWTFQDAGDFPEGVTIGGDGKIYLGGGNANIYCLRPNRNVHWSFQAAWEGGQAGQAEPGLITSDGRLIVNHFNEQGLMGFYP